MLAAYPEVVACDVVETLGGVVKDGHLMVEGQGDPVAVAYLLTEIDIVVTEDLPAAFAKFQAEVEIHAVDEEFGVAGINDFSVVDCRFLMIMEADC